jgi:coatomer protein complex subunit alpha (xenin)
MQGICDQKNNPPDSIPIQFDSRNHFVTCASTMQPIYTGQPSVECGYCKAPYLQTEKGKLCKVCDLSEIGLACTGLHTLRPQQ